MADDPPIIVGGGGSTLVWMKNNTTPTKIDDPTTVGNAPSAPKHPEQYIVFRCDARIAKNHVKKDKDDNGTLHDRFDPDTHRTDFE